MRANDRFYPQQWSLPMVRLPEAWATTGGSSEVVVAILDTGIVPGHPDLAGRLLPGYDFISNPDSADDGDMRRDPDPTDTGTVDTSRLHGTHVAGILGALTGNRLVSSASISAAACCRCVCWGSETATASTPTSPMRCAGRPACPSESCHDPAAPPMS